MDAQVQSIEREREILHPFGLVPSGEPGRVFESQLIYAAADIREAYPRNTYDHKWMVSDYDKQFPFIQTEQFRRGYSAFKHTVARVLQPRTICEIGIGSGVAALAFLDACPSAHYTGIDDWSKNAEEACGVTDHAVALMSNKGYRNTIIQSDSLKLSKAPRVDLFHVDGAHDLQHASNDTRLAFESESEWILVDDARDPVVAAGVFGAAYAARKWFHWAYFEDTWTGSILIHRVNG